MLSEKEIEAVYKHTLQLGCPDMVLQRGDGVEEYSGGGVIEQSPDGQLTFFLVDRDCSVDPTGHIERLLGGERPGPGKFIPDGHYFKLVATDTNGRTWRSNPTVEVDSDLSQPGKAVVRGELREIRSMADRKLHPLKKPFVRCWLLRKLSIPFNKVQMKGRTVRGDRRLPGWERNTADFQTRYLNIRISDNDKGRQFIRAVNRRPRKDLRRHLQTRLIETLQFTTGHPVDWAVLETGGGDSQHTHVRSIQNTDRGASLRPPLPDSPDFCDDYAKLFESYLDYVSSWSEEGWHPVSGRVYTLQKAMATLWNIQLVVAGVEVEGILRDEYGLKAKRKPEHALKELGRDGIVHDECVRAWLHMRGKAAHAYRGETEISDHSFLLLNQMVELFYELVFNRIGYSGTHRYLGAVGQPVRHYPPVSVCLSEW